MNYLDTDIVREVKELIQSVKRNYLAISVKVYQIHESREWDGLGDEWVDFYKQELELSKSQVSKMLKVGEFVLKNGMLKETVSYERLYLSINRNPDGDPKLILAEAQTWSADDHKAQKKDDCKDHDYHMVCVKCWKSV